MQTQDIAQVGRWIVARDDDGLRVYNLFRRCRDGGSTVEVSDLVDLKRCVEAAVARLKAEKEMLKSESIGDDGLYKNPSLAFLHCENCLVAPSVAQRLKEQQHVIE